ncbi:hypothetical protein EYY60_07170 [Flavobacterium zhairuonense]|uniref:hypothetical protein n=1 Tax=Flavobacterium zhairuonense TaxID=2493631 RepID=UPI001046BCE2|nr:hypothetical protein [Flavobacterium zhairuonense]KAF2512020.1 hypothetical protein EYY60_07170 [Flavobacterium zhairuonense]
MKKVNVLIKKNPEIITLIIWLIIFVAVGLFYNNLKAMLIVFLGIVVFGILIGIMPFLANIFKLIYYLSLNFYNNKIKKESRRN